MTLGGMLVGDRYAMPRVALTCDDAPTIQPDLPHVHRDPGRMDRVRATLKRQGVRRCVAFVIGSEATDHDALDRWLRAGYELGNHSWGHRTASTVGAEEFLQSLRRCDALLRRHGAWRDNPLKWFRFPYLDYGKDPTQRQRLAAAVTRLGYRIAHASVDLSDDCFEHALGDALAGGESLRVKVIGARYRGVAYKALAAARARFGPSAPQVPYFHFGAVSECFFEDVLARWIRAGTRLCALEDALGHPALRRTSGTGLLLGTKPVSLVTRVVRRAKRLSNRIEPSHGRWLGPPWPAERP